MFLRSSSATDKRRSASGFSAVELSASVLVTLLVVAIAVDAALLTFGSIINDRSCRDAAKAACAAANYAQAFHAAQKAVRARQTGGLFITPPQISDFDYHTFEGEPPEGEIPYVSVTTTLIVELPAARLIFNRLRKNDGVLFSQTYTFPLTEHVDYLPGHSWAVSKPTFSTRVLNP